MKRLTKQQLVLEIYDREAMGEVTAAEIEIINRTLIAEYGEGGAMEPAEIASILNQEELPIRFDQIFRMDSPTEKYEQIFRRLNGCGSLNEAEMTLRRVDELYGQFQQAGDKTGMRFARQAAMRLKQQTTELSQSPKLSELRRIELGEIAQWATIWLQTPGVFAQWLELRKASAVYKTLFQDKNSGPK
ncbi:MAG: hypothetical protein SF097_25695 [Acidobacteriota bacterium]|nr:hypothetical protein [Acidobacteriota bacterium]